MKQLSAKEVEALYKFTKQHYVEYYDLQIELVDHIATDIEHIWQEQPNLTFTEARDKAFKKFGIFGFMSVVEKRQTTMEKKYFRLILEQFKEWFKVPQITATLALFLSFYLLFLQFPANFVVGGIVIITGAISIINLWRITREQKQEKKEGKPKWLLKGLINRNAGMLNIFIVPQAVNWFNFFSVETISTPKIIFLSVFFTLQVIYSYISLVVLPKNMEYYLQQTYPEYSM